MRRQWDLIWRSVSMSLILITLVNSMARADADDCPPGCEVCALKKNANALVPGVTWGADLRLRTEYLDNAKLDDADDNSSDVWRQRFRARVWTTAQATDDVTLAARLTTEPWYFSQPDGLDEQFTRDEALIDQLYIDWKGIGQ